MLLDSTAYSKTESKVTLSKGQWEAEITAGSAKGTAGSKDSE
ncbi:hypothetical protein SAMN05421503_2032 [Terribacillus aidingensis]|uniref:Uncharacterized protein n=1 Tax=Terribacillus aidingensis TaxID=586416 RepID=A0A285NQZ7_9BACI|nr:hypothetical protein SAMN05421503_2032 [Terribacillus aidingensis]